MRKRVRDRAEALRLAGVPKPTLRERAVALARERGEVMVCWKMSAPPVSHGSAPIFYRSSRHGLIDRGIPVQGMQESFRGEHDETFLRQAGFVARR